MSNDKRKIVIFDDDEDIISICQYVLEENGFEVHTFTDCIDPIAKVTPIRPDVILMDNWIPEDGGIITTQKLKKNTATEDILVIYFSANSNIKALAEAAGADAYLPKPFDLEQLENLIEETLA